MHKTAMKKRWTVDVAEFVTKAMNDKAFMFEVFTHVPDSMTEDNEPPNPDDKGQVGIAFGRLCFPGAVALGYPFTEDELLAECDRQFGALAGFGKMRFVARMLKTLRKAKPRK
jgi:hypothetical protein